jgi:Glucodextranase, domain B/PKD domain
MLIHPKHTLRLRPHEHTSYASLFFMLIVAGLLMVGVSWSALAAQPAVNPQSGSIGLTGTIPGPPPSTAAVILSPSNGTTTNTIPITVTGTCPSGTFVSVQDNNSFAGAVTCQADGTFNLLVDLFNGTNSLVARVSDNLGQYGPNSTAVTVIYNAPAVTLASGSLGAQLFLESSVSVAAANPGDTVSRTVTIVGGIPPYAVSFDWGDNTTSLSSQSSAGNVTGSHIYTRPGTYEVIVRVTDSIGNSAYMQMVEIINGPVSALGATNGNGLGSLPGDLLTAWPVYVAVGVLVVFFWLGERKELFNLRRKHLIN